MPAAEKNRLKAAIYVPPEGVAQITGTITYDGRWYEDLGRKEVGAYEDGLSGEQVPGRLVQQWGRVLQVVDDGNPTTPVWYEPYEGVPADYKPTKRSDDYAANIEKYIVGGAFDGHPTEGKE